MVRRFHCEGKAMHYPQCEACTATIENTFATKEEAIAAWNRAMSRDCLHCEKLEAKIRDPYIEGREDAFEAIVADLRRLADNHDLAESRVGGNVFQLMAASFRRIADTYERGELMTEEPQ